jgi:ABC-type transporter Mla MlaB component
MRREGDTLHLEGAVTIATVTEVDSAAIALALELKRDAVSRQSALAFLNLPPALHKLIELYDVEDHLAG